MSFENLPEEMKRYDQWVVWRFEDVDAAKPTKVPYSAATGRLAKTNDARTWCTYEQAAAEATNNPTYDGLGFVLTDDDPYAFLDLDDTKGDQDNLDKQIKIYNEFDSYAEKSPSGEGLHIIVKGAIPSGRKRSQIEVYSSGRYMTMTGNVYRESPIKDYNELINILWAQLGEGRKADMFYAGLEKAKLTDAEVLEIAMTAQNADKFNELYYHGNWQKYYPSQSEADFACFDIIAFYSENGEQTQRIFLNSVLAQREKSRAQYRLNYMLNRCFDRMLPPVDIDGLKNQLEEALAKKAKIEVEKAKSLSNEKPKAMVKADNEIKPDNGIFSVPPGLVGEIAQFIYAQAPRPVAEIALAGALGLVAGITGRSYNVSGTGLNQYILLLAPTGTGKEAIASGIDKLMNAVVGSVPSAIDFIGPAEIASSQAVIKYMSKGPTSFVSLVGEFGIYLQQMASVNAPPHLMGLRRFLLDAYNKSGEGKVLRPSIYSDKDKNTLAILAPSFTLLGESTPEKFYEGLHEGLISEGLLPRFTSIEYHGPRPPLNQNHLNAKPGFELIERLSTLCAHSLMLNGQNKAINVQYSKDAKALFDKFDKHCDANINTSEKEIRRHLWNRAHMKALKLASLVAVGNNPYDPIIDLDVATWATDIIVADVRNLLDRFNAGEIGIDNDETKQLTKVSDTLRDFVISAWPEVKKYAGDNMGSLHSNKIIPYAYIQRRLASVAVFRKDRIGSSGAIKRALKTLTERGDIQEVSRAVMSKDYNSSALAFMISNPKAFNL